MNLIPGSNKVKFRYDLTSVVFPRDFIYNATVVIKQIGEKLN